MNGVNLHAVVRDAVASLNPDEDVILYQSAGQAVVSGHATPLYGEPIAATAQIQSESDEALYQSDNAGQNDITKKFYLCAGAKRPAGIIRPLARGGDVILRVSDGTWWLITGVIDDFSRVGWTSARCTLQVNPPEGVSP
jgi:hypothetical protein